MACKFKFGDKVEVNGHKGKITSIYQRTNAPDYICTVVFDDTKLIPNKMDFKESVIKMLEEHVVSGGSDLKCTCGIEATYGKIPVENHKYYCDLKTKKNTTGSKLKKEFKKEDVKPPGSISNTKVDNSYDDLLEQFEQMLGTNDDDDDDFGFYGV